MQEGEDLDLRLVRSYLQYDYFPSAGKFNNWRSFEETDMDEMNRNERSCSFEIKGLISM